jgi:hypothetical protein
MTERSFAHCHNVPPDALPKLLSAYKRIAAARGLIPDTGKAANLATDLVNLYLEHPKSLSKFVMLYTQSPHR